MLGALRTTFIDSPGQPSRGAGKTALLVGAGAIVLLLPAILNGFPFVFQDTADYIIFTPRIYRSPFYGVFIFLFHLNRFIWLPVIAQALITSHVLNVLLRVELGQARTSTFLVLIVALTAVSSLPWFVGFLMPDIFSGIMILAFYLLGFRMDRMSSLERLYLFLLAALSVAVHTSHLPLALGLVGLFGAMGFWSSQSWRGTLRRGLVLLCPIALAAIAAVLFNAIIFGKVSASPSGSVFLLANLIEGGPGRHYIEASCPGQSLKICVLVGRLATTGNEFLWTDDQLASLGGFAEMSEEAAFIDRETVKSRPSEVAGLVAANAWRALWTHAPGAELTPSALPPRTALFDLIALKFGPSAEGALRSSAQMRDSVPRHELAVVDSWTVPAAMLAILGLAGWARWRGGRGHGALVMFVVGGVLGNLLLCSAFSGVFDRYQARVTWLLIAVAVLLIVDVARQSARGDKEAGHPA